MKNLFLILIISFLSLPATPLKAQDTKKLDTLTIKTSAQCDMCKNRLEKAFAYEKGVKKSELDVETATFTVVYVPKKTNPEKLKEAVTKVGYDADELPANEKAYEQLPDCCKKGGHK